MKNFLSLLKKPKQPVNIITDDLSIYTEGLSQFRHQEILIGVVDALLLAEANTLASYIVNYIASQNTTIKSGETMIYGYWHVRFQFEENGFLEVYELRPDCLEYIPGATMTLTYFMLQMEICRQHGVEVDAPFSHDYAMVSDGVLEGAAVEGARYPASPRNQNHEAKNLSGWYFTSNLFNGDINSMRPVPLYHISSQRPELARYLALPAGHWVASGPDGYEVGFDPGVAAQEPV